MKKHTSTILLTLALSACGGNDSEKTNKEVLQPPTNVIVENVAPEISLN